MGFLKASQLGRLEDGRPVLSDVSFEQQPLQNIALAGATGSGKTTLLKILAGLTEATTGTVFFKGERLKGPNEKLLPGHPAIAYLSQQFELRNHYRVREILDMAKKVSDEEAARVSEVCRVQHLLQRWTHQLSGGERQRIALARLLVTAPQLLLLDEPYSNLDPFHKNVLKTVVADVSAQLQTTCVLVSHDPADTLSWADTILVLKNGRLIQEGTPQEIYRRPADEYTAALFGKYTVLTTALAKALSPYTDVRLDDLGRFVRPEEFRLASEGQGLPAVVEKVLFLGSSFELTVRSAGTEMVALSAGTGWTAGQTVWLTL